MAREGVSEWVSAYCERNKIPARAKLVALDRNYYGPTEKYRELEFSSRWQRDCFLRAGNREYPYFEFR